MMTSSVPFRAYLLVSPESPVRSTSTKDHSSRLRFPENLKTAMAEYLESAGPEADLTAAPPVAVASTSAAVTQSAVVDPEIEKKGSQFIAALGGPSNIETLEPCAETRLRD